MLRSFLAILPLISLSLPLIAETKNSNVGSKEADSEPTARLDYLRYRQPVQSSGSGYLLGESLDLEAAWKYEPNPKSFIRLKLLIDSTSSEQNKTSKLQLLLNHRPDQFELQGDVLTKFDDYNRGATTLGLDTKSDDTLIRYLNPSNPWQVTFYPYNFGSDIGTIFRSGDVAKLHYIDGTPDLISAQPNANTQLMTKTIPGIEFKVQLSPIHYVAISVGAARYLYPKGANFKIQDNVTAETWEAKTDTGTKVALRHRLGAGFFGLSYVSHTKSDEGGSLLKASGNLESQGEIGPLGWRIEEGFSQAGDSPYHLNRSETWFQQVAPFRPVYSDFYGNPQDWIGKKDTATFLKGSYKLGAVSPYVSLKSIGKNFIFREAESAHRLRTADQTASHGGLTVVGLGSDIRAQQFVVTPEIELKTAKEKVFVHKGQLRSDRQLSELTNKETAVTVYVTYQN